MRFVITISDIIALIFIGFLALLGLALGVLKVIDTIQRKLRKRGRK